MRELTGRPIETASDTRTRADRMVEAHGECLLCGAPALHFRDTGGTVLRACDEHKDLVLTPEQRTAQVRDELARLEIQVKLEDEQAQRRAETRR